MAKDLVYVFDKRNNRSSLLGEIQSDFNMSLVIDGTKDSTTIIVWSYSGVEIEPWSIVLHEKTMTWWCVSHDKVERYQNDDGSFVWLHNLELNGAIELLNARDLTDCGFNDRTYTVSDFIHRLFKLSNIEYTLTINAETNFLNKQVDFIKTFENYTLLSALREFLDAYNMCPKITFSYVTSTILAKYALTGINLKIVPKTGNRSRVHQMDDFDDVRETKTMDKNSFGTTVVSNAENVISSISKTYPTTGGTRLSGTEYLLDPTTAVIRLPSKVYKGNWLKIVFSKSPVVGGGRLENATTLNIGLNVNPLDENSLNSGIEDFLDRLDTAVTSAGYHDEFFVPLKEDFEEQIDRIKNDLLMISTVVLYDGNKINPINGNIIKGDNVPSLSELILYSKNLEPQKPVIFCDKNTTENLKDRAQGISWERGSNLITNFKCFVADEGKPETIGVASNQTELYKTKGTDTVFSFSNNYGYFNLSFSYTNSLNKMHIVGLHGCCFPQFIVNYIPMSDIKIKVDNQRDKRDIQLYNQNGKLTDSVALSKLLNSYSKEISSDTITKYMHYYSYNDVPQVGDIVMDGNVEYVINNVSIDFTQNETSASGEFGYFLDCEITMSKYVSTKSLMVNPNTNIRDYGIPQNYNVKRKQLYRDYYELSYYDDINANLETPYLDIMKVLNITHSNKGSNNFVAVMKLNYDDYVGGGDATPSDEWYYQLETTNYLLNKMYYCILDFNDNNILGYGSQNVYSGFVISRIFSGQTDNLITPIQYTDDKGKVLGFDVLLMDNEQLTTAYSKYMEDNSNVSGYQDFLSKGGGLYNYTVFIPKDIYDYSLLDYSIRITDDEYNKDALEVPVFEYVCQIDDSEYVLIGDNILQQYGSDFVYFYSYVYGNNINQNNAFTTTRVVVDNVSGNSHISFASEFSYDATNKELSISVWNESEYNPSTNTWQYGTRQNFVRNKDYAIFRHAYNVNTGEEIIDLMLIAKKVQKDDNTDLVLKVNHYKLK